MSWFVLILLFEMYIYYNSFIIYGKNMLKTNLSQAYNIIIWKEWEFFVSRVLENDISSFWGSQEECLQYTKEALELYEQDDYDNDFVIKLQQPHLFTILPSDYVTSVS